jgi:hypothetical protein
MSKTFFFVSVLKDGETKVESAAAPVAPQLAS